MAVFLTPRNFVPEPGLSLTDFHTMVVKSHKHSAERVISVLYLLIGEHNVRVSDDAL